MANPVINDVLGVPTAPVTPGSTVDLQVSASDPDSQTITVEFTVTDQAGNTSAPVGVTVEVNDPLTFTATATSGSIVQDANDPTTFHLTV